jgi:hypothetical protein
MLTSVCGGKEHMAEYRKPDSCILMLPLSHKTVLKLGREEEKCFNALLISQNSAVVRKERGEML